MLLIKLFDKLFSFECTDKTHRIFCIYNVVDCHDDPFRGGWNYCFGVNKHDHFSQVGHGFSTIVTDKLAAKRFHYYWLKDGRLMSDRGCLVDYCKSIGIKEEKRPKLSKGSRRRFVLCC